MIGLDYTSGRGPGGGDVGSPSTSLAGLVVTATGRGSPSRLAHEGLWVSA